MRALLLLLMGLGGLHAHASINQACRALLQTGGFASQLLLAPIFSYPPGRGFCSQACLGNLALLLDTAANWGCKGESCRDPQTVAIQITERLRAEDETRSLAAMLPEEIHRQVIDIAQEIPGAHVHSTSLLFLDPWKLVNFEYKRILKVEDIIGDEASRAQVAIAQMALIGTDGRRMGGHAVMLFPELAPSNRVAFLDSRIPQQLFHATLDETSDGKIMLVVDESSYRQYYATLALEIGERIGRAEVRLGHLALQGATRIQTLLRR